jgi:thioredoxin reductase
VSPEAAGDVDVAAFDVVVVGGGVAGTSAATWAARYRRSVIVFDSGEPRNRWADEAHGYFGSDPVSPRELLDRARRGLARYPNVVVCPERVTRIERDDSGFQVTSADGRRWRGLRLVMATGVRDVFPDVENFFDHYGTSVHHCASCDAYEAQGQRAVVIGNGEQAAGFAMELLDWVSTITIITDGEPFNEEGIDRDELAEHNIRVVESRLVSLTGPRGALRAAETADAASVACEVAFFTIAHVDHDDLLNSLGCARTDEGCVIVDDNCETTVEGIYAAGDITPGIHMVQVAAAKGAVAGASAARSLRGERGAPRSPRPAPDPEAHTDG